jgi:hypothetical protein
MPRRSTKYYKHQLDSKTDSSFQALWTKDGKAVVYPCHAVIISMDIKSGYQRFFIGHTDKVSGIGVWKLAMEGMNTVVLGSNLFYAPSIVMES